MKKTVVSFMFSGIALASSLLAAGDPPSTNVPPAVLPAVKIIATDPVALEGASSGAFTVFRNGDATASLTVQYAISGTASNGVDYVTISNAVTLASGALSSSIVVQPIDNHQFDPDKTVVLTLATNANYRLASHRKAEVKIIDNVFNNFPPVVSLVAPTNGTVVAAGTNVTLRAEASDPDDVVQRVSFFANERLLGSATNAPFSLIWSNVPPGKFLLEARATDRFGESSESAEVTLTVTNARPSVKLTAPTNNAIFAEPAKIEISAEASDPDDSIARVSFFANNEFIGTAKSSPFRIIWSLVPPGKYAIVAKATDQFGASTKSEAVHIVVTNRPPTVVLVAPKDGEQFELREKITLKAEATDGDGKVVKVSFFADNRFLGSVFRKPFEFVWTHTRPGDFKLRAQATDEFGATAKSEPVHVTVHPSTKPPQSDSEQNEPKVKHLPGGAVELTFSVPVNGNFQVEFSRDLKTWVPLGIVASENGQVKFVDNSVQDHGRGFYRAVPVTSVSTP